MRFFDELARRRLGAGLAKLGAWLITMGHAVLLPFAARAQSGDGGDAVAIHALGWLSWVVGGAIALSACGSRDERRPERALALARGHSAASAELAEVLAVARRVLRLVGIPALLLCALALAMAASLRVAALRLTLLVGGVGYSLLLASVVAVLVSLSRTLSHDKPRSALLALVFVPHFVHVIFPIVPSVPALLSSVLGLLMRLGSAMP